MPRKEEKDATGKKQSDFAGTNPDRYGDPAKEQNNPVDEQEAQNVTDGDKREYGKDAEQDRNKSTEGIRQGRDERK